MSSYNKVLWSEGLFLRPQHFQQQDRYVEHYIDTRCRAAAADRWGLIEFELERDLLGVGKLGIRRAFGVFPDGTPFCMPDDDLLPAPLDIGPGVRDQVVYLSLPLRRPGSAEVTRGVAGDGLERHSVRDEEVRDATLAPGATALLEVGPLRVQLLLQADVLPAYSCVPIAQVVEVRADRSVVLDETFIPTVLHARTSARLATFVTEVLGLLHQRGEALAARVSATGRGGAAEIADFLMLQMVNRTEPVLAHHAGTGTVHPETLFRLLVSLAGELATFTTSARRPAQTPAYEHARLRESFEPVMVALRSALSAVIEQNAIPIPVELRRFNIRVAVPTDRSLFRSAMFVLAARADVAAEELRRSFPTQLKVGPVEEIANLVNVQLPGVPVQPLPVAPRQIPYHAGFVYFEFTQSHPLWARLETSGGLAMHVAGDFPGLAVELWAIRG